MLSRKARSERRAGPASRPLRPAAGSLIALVLFAAGCGEGADEAVPDADANLEITLDVDGPGGERGRSAELVCGSDGSRACARLEELSAESLAPVPPDAICTQIYGGDDVVTIQGTLRGERVDAKLTRANGCEIERFNRFMPVLEEVFPSYEPGSSLRP